MLVSIQQRDLPAAFTTKIWENGDTLLLGRDGLEAYSSKFSTHYASLNEVNGQSDVELLVRAKIDTLVSRQGLLVVRGNRVNGDDCGYVLGLWQAGSNMYMKVDNSDKAFDQAVYVPYPKEWNWYRFSVKGSTIKAKFWRDGYPEPAWQIIINDTKWPYDSNGISGIAHFSGGIVTYNYAAASTDDRPAPAPGDYVDTYVNPKPEPDIGYWGAPGLRPLGAIQLRKKVSGNYSIEGGESIARITATKPSLTHKYSIVGNKGYPWVQITPPRVTYKEPGKLYISPSTEVARIKISQPTLSYKAPPNTNVVGKTTTARIATNLPSITSSSKHTIIADETIVHIEVPQPTIVFKDVERYTFYIDPVTARIRTTTPLVRFKRVQINPDVWSTPQQRIEQEWRKLPVSSEATGTWRQHKYVRSNDQVWRDRRREDTS